MILQGDKKLNQYLHNWFKTFCDFDYTYVDDRIHYAFVVPDIHDKMFFDVCKEIEPKLESCDNFLLSLFHEVGHYMTQEDFDDSVWEDYDAKSDWGNDYNGYYHHPIEYEATKAGIELMLSKRSEIPELLSNIQLYEKEILNELGYKLS